MTIQTIAEQKIVESIVKWYTSGQNVNDFSQDIYIILLKSPTLIESMSEKELRNYIINIAKKQIYSSTSPFYKNYTRWDLAQQIDTYEDIEEF